MHGFMCISSSIGFVAPRCAQRRFPPLRQVKTRIGTHRHALPAVQATGAAGLRSRVPSQSVCPSRTSPAESAEPYSIGTSEAVARPCDDPLRALQSGSLAWQARVEHRVRRVGVGEALDPAALEPVVDPRGIALLIASVSATGPPPLARPPTPSGKIIADFGDDPLHRGRGQLREHRQA